MIRAAEPPTLREIAATVGVTPTTVSLAFRDSPRISEATRQRVKQVADDLGYRPNAELSRVMMQLKTRRQSDVRPVMALVISGDGNPKTENHLRGLFQGMAEAAGYGTDVIRLKERGMNFSRLADILRNRGIRGALLYREEGPVPASLDWLKGLALCCIGPAPKGSRLPSFDWEETGVESRPDEALVQTAMNWLDYNLQHHRFGAAEYAMTLRLAY